MCLILFSYNRHPLYRLILAANRDEFYERKAARLDYWPDMPNILAGRDLKAAGTWLGIDRQGRWAAVTNYRDPGHVVANALSRGNLVVNYLSSNLAPDTFLYDLKSNCRRYNGFNLLAGGCESLAWFSNRADQIRILQPGLYGLSNRLLDDPWPKVLTGKKGLKQAIASGNEICASQLLPILTNDTQVEKRHLPDTGIGIELEKILSPLFITSKYYGTRCSSVLTITYSNEVEFTEYTWHYDGQTTRKDSPRTFRFSIQP
ncbi:MAG: NRDE family protein [Desulfobacteraceae bacterium]|nr:NRDE family protein [Desulfobacteraceae bacterium]